MADDRRHHRGGSAIKKVAIILVKYNQPELEAATIRHVLDTVDHPNWTLVAHQNERGKGLAKCWNELIAAQDAEYIVLLNTDTVPTRGWLDKLVAALDAGADVAVPSSNRVHLSQIDTSNTWATDPEHQETIDLFSRKLAAKEGNAGEFLPTASAMCVAFRRSMWEALGGFDEDFFLYGEDTEFFYRAAQSGHHILWVRGAYVHHYGQRSMAKAAADGELDYGALREAAATMFEQKKAEVDKHAAIQSEIDG